MLYKFHSFSTQRKESKCPQKDWIVQCSIISNNHTARTTWMFIPWERGSAPKNMYYIQTVEYCWQFKICSTNIFKKINDPWKYYTIKQTNTYVYEFYESISIEMPIISKYIKTDSQLMGEHGGKLGGGGDSL